MSVESLPLSLIVPGNMLTASIFMMQEYTDTMVRTGQLPLQYSLADFRKKAKICGNNLTLQACICYVLGNA
jgi:hypothetical protein